MTNWGSLQCQWDLSLFVSRCLVTSISGFPVAVCCLRAWSFLMQRTIMHYFVVVCTLKKHKWIGSEMQALSQSLHTGGGQCSKYKPLQNTVHYLTCAHFQRLILPALKRHGLINLSDNLVFSRHKNILQISIQRYYSFSLSLKHEMNLKHDQQERAKSILHA